MKIKDVLLIEKRKRKSKSGNEMKDVNENKCNHNIFSYLSVILVINSYFRMFNNVLF